MRYENDTSQLAPGGVASFADGVRQQRYSVSREGKCGDIRSCASNECTKKTKAPKDLS